MNKQQRKRAAQEKKARAKAARKAKNQALREPQDKPFDEAQDKPFDPSTRLGAGGAQGEPFDPSTRLGAGGAQDRAAGPGGPGGAPTDCAGYLSAEASAKAEDARTTDAGRDAHITEDAHTTITPSMTQEELRADPELMEAVLASQHRDEESVELMDTAHEAEREVKWARGKVKEAHSINSGQAVSGRRITDQRALEMLEDAAEATHDVLLMVRDALRGVSPERRAAARAILNEKPRSGVDGRKLPRRAPDPVVTLEKLSLQAASLLKRILAKTNPNVGKKAA